MFSPYYAWSGWTDPFNHCAVNVALYNASGSRWAMTERGRRALQRDEKTLFIGPSNLSWDGRGLAIHFDEMTAPLPSRLRGTVRLYPEMETGQAYDLDAAGRHIWRPIAPRARVEVTVEKPACAWSGNGYFDTNSGPEPLTKAFASWDWSRAHLPKDSLLFYDVVRRDGVLVNLALRVGANGETQSMKAPARSPLPGTFWRVPRTARGEAIAVRRTLEDTPFYTRSALDGRYGGEAADIVHESLSLDRLDSPAVRAMLPFRMPRVLR